MRATLKVYTYKIRVSYCEMSVKKRDGERERERDRSGERREGERDRD